jgi:hypothetical protein
MNFALEGRRRRARSLNLTATNACSGTDRLAEVGNRLSGIKAPILSEHLRTDAGEHLRKRKSMAAFGLVSTFGNFVEDAHIFLTIFKRG